MLPKKITPESKVHLVHTSSPVEKSDISTFEAALKKIKERYLNTRLFDVQRSYLDLRYLSASESERLHKFRQAIKEANWLLPVYGGTGCEDIIRHLTDSDLIKIRKNRPIVNGFSDTTFLINYLYFELKLQTFHYSNVCGLRENDNNQLFFDVVEGRTNSFSFKEQNYSWHGPAGAPQEKIEGIAIGGNISTFRDLLDMYNIKLRTWDDYILFAEDIDMDIEDLHRVIIALDERGVFRHIKALVIGRFSKAEMEKDFRKFNRIFGKENDNTDKPDRVFEYLLSDVLAYRKKAGNPLYILAVDNFGHDVEKNTMLVPIGGKTTIYPDKKIEFTGPFVD
ncbi:MAG: LD-carboxypeptidase [Candidatus Magasanikbacteria bacterium]|nr:LD-carboxypeptidase [Candidatus Magasanikbacteria bacterium]